MSFRNCVTNFAFIDYEKAFDSAKTAIIVKALQGKEAKETCIGILEGITVDVRELCTGAMRWKIVLLGRIFDKKTQSL